MTLGVWLTVADVRVARAVRSWCLFRLRRTLFAVTGGVLACGVLSGAVTENEADVQRMRAVVPLPTSMLYAYFGGTTATGTARYEVLLQQAGVCYTVVAVHQAPPPHPALSTRPWCLFAPRLPARPIVTTPLYRGRDARTALRVLLDRACAVVNTPVLGQRYCYVLPRGDASARLLAPLVPGQLRYNNTLPEHPQVWQVGRSLHHLPHAWHADACPDRRMFGDERSTWAWR